MDRSFLRTLIVDDEELARERLRQMLRPFGDLLIVGEAEDGEEAIEQISELRPDLVFLDIQMPGCTGLEVVASLPSPRPRIIFCTAFDQYAIDAFELHAVDYLLKPVSRVRLAKAIERVRNLSAETSESILSRISLSDKVVPRRFLAKRGGRYRVIQESDVLYFASEGGLTKLCAREHEYWIQPTLADLEARLDPAVFFRISRATIVNLNEVNEVTPLVGGYGEVLLKGGRRLEVSRRRMKNLLETLGDSK